MMSLADKIGREYMMADGFYCLSALLGIEAELWFITCQPEPGRVVTKHMLDVASSDEENA